MKDEIKSKISDVTACVAMKNQNSSSRMEHIHTRIYYTGRPIQRVINISYRDGPIYFGRLKRMSIGLYLVQNKITSVREIPNSGSGTVFRWLLRLASLLTDAAGCSMRCWDTCSCFKGLHVIDKFTYDSQRFTAGMDKTYKSIYVQCFAHLFWFSWNPIRQSLEQINRGTSVSVLFSPFFENKH